MDEELDDQFEEPLDDEFELELDDEFEFELELELRLELVDFDNHDAVLAEWEKTLDEATRERLRSQGYRLASDAA